MEELRAIAYTDGSYNERRKMYGSGAYVVIGDRKPMLYSKGGNRQDVAEMRQIGGELYAVVQVLEYCKEQGVTHLDLYYDYAGISEWALPKEKYVQQYDKYIDNCRIRKVNLDPRVISKYTKWKANKLFTMWYQFEIISKMQEMKITFNKVEAHTGNELNEKVDGLAKKACGLC